MKSTSTTASWAQGLILMSLVVIAGAASFAANVWFGMQFHPAIAVFLGLSDIAKITLPAIAVLTAWNLRKRIAHGVAVTLSIMSALCFMVQTQGNTLLEAKQQNAVVQQASASVETLRTELASIKEALPSKTLADMHKATNEAATREGNRGFCGPKCEGLKAEAVTLLARLGEAKRREALEAQLADAKQTVKSTPEKTIGPAKTLAQIMGVDEAMVGSIVLLAVSLLVLVLTESVAMLSDTAMTMLRNAARKSKANKPVKLAEVSPEPTSKLTEAECLHKMQMMIWNSPGRQLISSNRELADQFGIAKSTFNDWRRRWQANGEIDTITSGNQTVFKARKVA